MVLHILVPPATSSYASVPAPGTGIGRWRDGRFRRARRRRPRRVGPARSLHAALLKKWLPVASRCAPAPLALLVPSARADSCGSDLHFRSEALLRQLLRRRRRALDMSQHEPARIASNFDISRLRAPSGSSMEGLAFALTSMYWFGCRHPQALHVKPVHPAAGLVRWLSSFPVQQQVDQGRQLLDRLVLEERRVFQFAFALVKQISSMTTSRRKEIILLPDLLKVGESAEDAHRAMFTTFTHEA